MVWDVPLVPGREVVFGRVVVEGRLVFEGRLVEVWEVEAWEGALGLGAEGVLFFWAAATPIVKTNVTRTARKKRMPAAVFRMALIANS
jgi:hypothetical protein